MRLQEHTSLLKYFIQANTLAITNRGNKSNFILFGNAKWFLWGSHKVENSMICIRELAFKLSSLATLNSSESFKIYQCKSLKWWTSCDQQPMTILGNLQDQFSFRTGNWMKLANSLFGKSSNHPRWDEYHEWLLTCFWPIDCLWILAS